MREPALSLRGLHRRFGAHVAVDDINLDVAPGEMVVLLGPSGCGKTTTLRLIAGFIAPDSGDILLDGRGITALPPHKRDMGIVFQSYALFPHLTVARNVAFGLEMRRASAREIQDRVREMLRLTRLEAFAARLPRHLSGGQQQRVALARALAIHPRALLLDEPLSNLDAALRQDMAREIRLLQQSRGITTIMVTHDQTEAMAMADRLVLMLDGKVQQIGTPEALHLRPANPFVAHFIGGANIIAGRTEGGTLLAAGASIALAGDYPASGHPPGGHPPGGHPASGYPASGHPASGPATLAIRPESIRFGAPEHARVAGTIELCTWLGATVEYVVRLGPGLTVLMRGSGAQPRVPQGTRVGLHWTSADEFLFDAQDRPQPAALTEIPDA